ncbi:MAG: deoxyribodipyrimidine photolyase [Bacteroidota bacterium]|nr:deoxyribodipyrimidine photolyase [Bacteroidota bacterium]MDX5431055.1 deoxyribodipyrimidine photolyase [Bacteroidota bacterium]MDX5469809.1 deoxyribodipyrimidine photolyase [Bacteroidota bacterium]
MQHSTGRIPEFPTDYAQILERVENIDPIAYGRSRNFSDGAVTHLSPYISRGVISTRYVANRLKERGFSVQQSEKLLQELAWRDHWQLQWKKLGSAINQDIRGAQQKVAHHAIPEAVLQANTGIEAIDKGIRQLQETGYLHNHLRMYLASICCNVGGSHWLTPARWMYYHLLDADWASNALSWQWVAGTNASKRYFANQDNINKYFYSKQKHTFLDVSYEELEELSIPAVLQKTVLPELKVDLPEQGPITFDPKLPTLLYTHYSLDPLWKAEIPANRILILEPGHFKEYPISRKSLDFILALGKNIPGLQVFIGEFSEWKSRYPSQEVYFKEHPFSAHFEGIGESREWMFPGLEGESSFFKFWKKAQKALSHYDPASH